MTEGDKLYYPHTSDHALWQKRITKEFKTQLNDSKNEQLKEAYPDLVN